MQLLCIFFFIDILMDWVDRGLVAGVGNICEAGKILVINSQQKET